MIIRNSHNKNNIMNKTFFFNLYRIIIKTIFNIEYIVYINMAIVFYNKSFSN